ncbi:histone H1-like repetitive region-containing protein [Nonomuraea sp. NPDC004580]|uniref:histone H1-like repetitive region-containing protein n=1 Tax=Nonomuraea sp. NPDC004580 TaxID=3154552 RepID=UPI0033A7E883
MTPFLSPNGHNRPEMCDGVDAGNMSTCQFLGRDHHGRSSPSGGAHAQQPTPANRRGVSRHAHTPAIRDGYSRLCELRPIVESRSGLSRSDGALEGQAALLARQKWSLALQERPVARRPVARRPVARRPVARRPVARRPVARRPVARRPVARRSMARRSMARRPVARRPVARRPVARSVERPQTRQPTRQSGYCARAVNRRSSSSHGERNR